MGIRTAHPRTALSVFGGKLSIAEYRDGFEYLVAENMLFPHQDVSVEPTARPECNNLSPAELGSGSRARVSRTKPYVPGAAYGERKSAQADPGREAARERSAMQAIRGSMPVKNSTYKLSRAKPLQSSGALFSALNDEW